MDYAALIAGLGALIAEIAKLVDKDIDELIADLKKAPHLKEPSPSVKVLDEIGRNMPDGD